MDEEQDIHDQKKDEGTTSEEGRDTKATLSLEEQLETLKAELEEADRERGQFRSLLQRVQADFVNYRRRAEEDREGQQKHANSRLILQLLPILDEFSLAIDQAPHRKTPVPWLEGVRLIHRKLHSLLESEGVTRIEAAGKGFDPFEHEALSQQESHDHGDGQVLMVVRDGYKLHGKVLRPAQVIVTKNSETPKGAFNPPEEKED